MLSLAIAYFAAYGIVRSDIKGKNLLVQSFLVLACLPVISYIMPLRKLLFVFHLYETFVGVVLAETAIYAPLAAFILYNYLKQVSTELEDSALIEGATTLQILRRIVFPITAQGVAATAIIIFVLSWNQVIIPLILAPPKSTVPVAMLDFFMMEREVEWPVAAAALIVSLSPIVIFVAAAYRVLAVFTIQVDNEF
jgi:multiple sugar transport system permease protein